MQAESQQKTFTYDQTYWSVSPDDPSYASQEIVNNDIGTACYDGLMKGNNACVLAYGQTGTGKTHSLLGFPPEVRGGLVHAVAEAIFSSKTRAKGEETRVLVSVMEIVGEQIRDLLQPGRSIRELQAVLLLLLLFLLVCLSSYYYYY